MNNKKIIGVGALAFLGIFLINSVSAYYMDFYGSINNIAWQIQPVAQFFLGGYDYTGYMLFERFLFFLIIFAITFVALVRAPFFEKQKSIVTVLSIVIPLLSVRYISFDWINTMLMSYQVFGIALVSILPFVIYFFFLIGIAPNYPGIRKIGWIFYGCVYLGLYATADNTFYGQVYAWTALAALAFFFLDKTIQNYFDKQKLKHNSNRHLLNRQLELDTQRRKLIDAGALDSKSPYYYQLKDVDSELVNLAKAINN